MSQLDAERGSPRWSLPSGPGAPLLSVASPQVGRSARPRAGLVGSNATVWVGPPLFWRPLGSSLGSTLIWSLLVRFVTVQPLLLPMTLSPTAAPLGLPSESDP